MSNSKKFNVFDIMEKAVDAISVDFSKVGEYITDLTIEQISKLPLKERKKVVSKLGEKSPDWMLKNLFGEDWLGAKLMARYVGGSGEDYHLDMSKKSWKKLINVAKNQADIVGGWTPSTNPDFPSEKGWEYVSGVNSIGVYYEDLEDYDIYNALAETTIRRRKLRKGKYEYQIAGETFDFVRGDGGGGGNWDRQVGVYGEDSSRIIPTKGAKIINDLFPEHTQRTTTAYLQRDSLDRITSLQTMEDFGTPFRILSRYIGK